MLAANHHPADRPTGSAHGPAGQAPEPSGPRILVVDDDPDVLASLAAVLQSNLGAEVVAVRSGFDARQRLDAIPFAMVIADERLPDLPGSALLAWLKGARPATARVLISAFHDSLSGPGAEAAEPHLTLWKASRVETMLRALRQVLAQDQPPHGDPRRSSGGTLK